MERWYLIPLESAPRLDGAAGDSFWPKYTHVQRRSGDTPEIDRGPRAQVSAAVAAPAFALVRCFDISAANHALLAAKPDVVSLPTRGERITGLDRTTLAVKLGQDFDAQWLIGTPTGAAIADGIKARMIEAQEWRRENGRHPNAADWATIRGRR